jgi:peptidoglycan/xylan/chitin deacetylase (PgdA/CDA1 family)
MRSKTATLVASGIALGGTAALAHASSWKSSQVFGPGVYRGPANRRSIALTFDDGPSEGTSELLEYLDQEDVKATFFQCGLNVRRRPAIAGQVAAAGHQLGNHTYSHPLLPLKTPAFIDREFTAAQEVIVGETGVTPMLLRAPYGLRWYGMGKVQQKLSLLGVHWTVIGNDWMWPAERIIHRVLRAASPGGIVCLHDARAVKLNSDIRETLAAVRTIVPALKDRGYTFETVSGLLGY